MLAGSWDKSYERKAVSLMAIGFVLVVLDRFIINPLFPIMQRELGLSYRNLGLISAVVALTWGVGSIGSGPISDRWGRKPVIVSAVFAFSLLAAATGLATGLLGLVAIRAVMGLAEGSYAPSSVVVIAEASKPGRVGLNMGLQQTGAMLVGFGLGPVIAVGLLKVLPSWHWVFAVVAVPGVIAAAVMMKVLRSGSRAVEPAQETPDAVGFRQVLRHRNVIFNAIGMCLYLTSLLTLTAFMPNYLTDHLGLDLDRMGGVLSGQGVGSALGMAALPAISDRFGRKPVMIVALIVEFLALWALMGIGADAVALFVALFVATFMNFGVVGINMGPLTTDSVPAAVAATATGLVIGVGEIFGGALAPAIAGGVADAMGIAVVIKIALAAVVLALVNLVFGVREPKPFARS